MTRREKFILSLTGLSLLGAGVYYVGPGLLPGSLPETAEATQVDLKAILPVLQSQFQQVDLTNRERRILELTEGQWGDDPFLQEVAVRGTVSLGAVTELVYSGYMAIGISRIGIISGREYVAGMWLEDGSHRILDITPTHVDLMMAGSSVEIRLEMEQEH